MGKKITLYRDTPRSGTFKKDMTYLSSTLKEIGYECEDIRSPDLREKIEDCDVLWIYCGNTRGSFSLEKEYFVERNVLEDNIGLLLQLCAGPINSCEFGGYFGSYTCRKEMLGEDFGVKVRKKKKGYGLSRQWGEYVFSEHPITEGLKSIGTVVNGFECLSPMEIDEEIVTPLAWYKSLGELEKGPPVLAIHNVCRVAVFSSNVNIFTDEFIDKRDNLKFATNLFQWLAGDLEEEGRHFSLSPLKGRVRRILTALRYP